MAKKFYSYSFGCRVNEAEKEVFDRGLIKKGLSFDQNNPDFYIINTCAVTSKAERETRQLIYRLRKQHPEAKIVITGCSATYWKKSGIYQNLPIDLVIDNKNKEFIVKIIQQKLTSPFPANLSNRLGCQAAIQSNKYNSSGRYIIKIQDGCQRFCTYCIVPYLRGLSKSKTIKQIINEVNHLPKNVKELILTAINTEAFGYDTKEDFLTLIKRLLEVAQIPRISFGSIHPWSINDHFFKFYKSINNNRLVNFFHIPLQSGSNKILNLMKRGYTSEEFIEKLNILRLINSKTLLATDIIVGFLDETDKDFENTYNFLKQTPINKFHIFRFSIRNNTAAYYMKRNSKETSPQTKMKRAKILAKLNQEKYGIFISSLINWNSSVLILDKKEENYYEGLLENQIPILIKVNKKPGEIVQVKVTDIKNNKLFGKII